MNDQVKRSPGNGNVTPVANAEQRLDAAQAAAREGRPAESLSGYVWFHAHALDDTPSLSGVRLSFALNGWRDLARTYPPALDALESTRDEAAARLRAGAAEPALFREVAAIDRTLEAFACTRTLFLDLHQRDPALAARCADVALPALVEGGDFALARRYVGEPEHAIGELASRFNESLEHALARVDAAQHDSLVEAFARLYADDAARIATIVRETQEPARSKALLEQAAGLVSASAARACVEARLAA